MPITPDEQRKLNVIEMDSRKSKMIMDSISGNKYREESMMQCRHPAVIKKYGAISGVVFLHLTRCRKCKHVITFPFFGGVKCGYEVENEKAANSKKQ